MHGPGDDRERAERDRERAERDRDRDRERAERDRDRAERQRARDERRSLADEIRRSVHGGLGHDIGRTIRESMSFDVDLADLTGLGGDEHSETIEADFPVEALPGLHVRNVSGDTEITVGDEGTIHVTARKRVRGTSGERAKRLLENVEVRMEQQGNEVTLRPHLYEQDRGWADLFRGGRVAVDFAIRVPREVRLDAQTVSGDVTLRGTRGPVEAQSVSGDLRLSDVQGPLRLRTVSGDGIVEEFAGQLAANTVSGDLICNGVRLHGSEIVTVSGDVHIDGELEPSREHRLKTISGDVELHLAGGSYDVRFSTMSGDLDSDLEAEVRREGRRDKHIRIGAGEGRVSVKTMSGDLGLRTSERAAPAASAAASAPLGAERVADDVERTEPMPAPAPPSEDVRTLLERVARGEVDVDAAAAALDRTRGR